MPLVACSACNNPLNRPHYRVRTQKNFYCSKACEAAKRKESEPRGGQHPQYHRVECVCFTCGVVFERQPSKRRTRDFCSVPCRERWQRESGYNAGENSPTWAGGYENYRGPDWYRQREAALVRDGYACVRCESIQHVQVHHIRPFREFDDYREANQIKNLETLCTRCHGLVGWPDRAKAILAGVKKHWLSRRARAIGQGEVEPS